MFRSQGCLFWCGLVIWYYSPRDALARCPQSCEGWVLNDESSKESKSWENEELDDLNTTLTSQWPPITSQLQAFSIRPGQIFWGGKKRERAVQDRPRFWAPVFLASPYHCTAGFFHLLPYLLQGIALLYLAASVKVSVIILSSVVFRDLTVLTMHHLTRIRRRSSNRPNGRTQKSFF